MSRFAAAALFCAVSVWAVGCTSKSAPTVPSTPQGTVEVVAKSLADKQPGVIWNALPASYQKDVNGLIQLFAQKMDKEVYDKSFDVLNKAIKVLGDKKDFILGHPMLAEGPVQKDELKKNWDTMVGMFRTLTGSEIRTLASLKSLDVGDFLAGTGAKLMAQASQVSKSAKDDQMGKTLDKLSKIKVEVVESGADAAKVRMTLPDEKPEEVEFVKVEGKWVPKDMANDWAKGIEEAKKGLEKMDPAKDKAQLMAVLRNVDGALESLLSAKNQEEFTKLAGQAMGQVMGGIMGGMGAAGPMGDEDEAPSTPTMPVAPDADDWKE